MNAVTAFVISTIRFSPTLSTPEEITNFWNSWLEEKQKHNLLDWWDKGKKNFKQIAIQRSGKLRQLERN